MTRLAKTLGVFSIAAAALLSAPRPALAAGGLKVHRVKVFVDDQGVRRGSVTYKHADGTMLEAWFNTGACTSRIDDALFAQILLAQRTKQSVAAQLKTVSSKKCFYGIVFL